MLTNITTNVNTNSGAMVIHSREQLENLRSVFNKKEKGVAMTNITIGTEGRVDISVLQVPYNLGTKLLDIKPTFVKTGSESANKIERFTKDMINVAIKDTEFASLASTTIFRVGEGLSEKFYVDTPRKGYVADLLTHEDVDASVVMDAEGKLLPGVRTYGGERGGQLSSASQLRKLAITMLENSDEDKVHRYIDHIDYGSFGLIEGTKTTMSGLVKYSARLGQAQSPVCMEDIPVGTMAIYADKWKNAEGNQYADGAAFVSNRYAATACTLASKGKFDIKERAVLGMVYQCRPWKAKVLAQCVEAIALNKMIELRGYETVRIDRNNVSPKDQAEFNKLFLKGEKSAFAGKLVVICDDMNAPIDFMTDLNGMKATYDLSRTSGFNILDIGNVQDTETGASTSMQMLQTLLYFSYEEGKKYIQKKGKAHLENKLSRLLSTEAQVPSIEEFDRLYAAGTIPKIARKFVLENNAAMFRNISDNFMKGLSREIGNHKFNLPGATAKIIPDFAMNFEEHLLGMDGNLAEVYCPAAEQYFTELGLPESEWIISGYKYPKMHVEEVLLARVISFQTIGARIDALPQDKDIKAMLRRQYKAWSHSVLVVPAIELLKNMLAGMDFDADAATLVFDKEYNDILLQSDKKPTAVIIENDENDLKKEEKTIQVKANMAWEVLYHFTENKNKSIGEITFMNDLTVAMLIMAQNGQLDETKEILKAAFHKHDYGNTYESPLTKTNDEEFGIPTIKVSRTLMNEVVTRIKKMKLSEKNILTALYDLAAINRMLQEITIDSAKTNDIIVVAYDLNKVAKSRARSAFGLQINWGKISDRASSIKWSVDNNPSAYKNSYGRKSKQYHLEETFHILRKEIARELFRAGLQLRETEHQFESDTLAMFKRIDARFPEERAMVVEAKLIYDDLTGIMRSETQDLSEDAKDQKRPIKEDYNLNIAALSNHVRRITKNLNPIERAMMLISVGENSAFAFTVCPEECVHMVLEHFADIDFAGEKLVKCQFETGEIVKFAGGRANAEGKLAIAKSDLTGEFEICEYSGRKYAAKKIADMVSIPEIDETLTIVKLQNLTSSNIKEVTEKIESNETVRLLALGAVGGDRLIIDGEPVFKICCNDNNLKKEKILKNIYNGATGEVARLAVGTSRGNQGKAHHVAILTLKNTIVTPPTMDEIKACKEASAKEKAERIEKVKACQPFSRTTSQANLGISFVGDASFF